VRRDRRVLHASEPYPWTGSGHVLAYFFGSKMAADAFFVAFRIPNLLRRFFAEGSLTIAFIPVFTETLTRKSKEDAFELARAVLTLLSLLLVVLTLLGFCCPPGS